MNDASFVRALGATMFQQRIRFDRVLKTLCGALISCTIILSAHPTLSQERTPSGTVEISQVQVAFLWSGNLGGGTLTYKGRVYEFTIGGLGIGGIGASSIEAQGEVYNLEDVTQFEGVYGQGRYGFAAGTESAGQLWLENPNGVSIRLEAERRGLALSLGADGIVIMFD